MHGSHARLINSTLCNVHQVYRNALSAMAILKLMLQNFDGLRLSTLCCRFLRSASFLWSNHMYRLAGGRAKGAAPKRQWKGDKATRGGRTGGGGGGGGKGKTPSKGKAPAARGGKGKGKGGGGKRR